MDFNKENPDAGDWSPARQEDNSQNSKIITPEQARKETYPEAKEVTLNKSGDIKDLNSKQVTTPDGEQYTPVSDQNSVDLNKYTFVNHTEEDNSGAADDKVVAEREQTTKNLMSEGARWRNKKQQFSKKGEGRLALTKQQMDTARKEMASDFNEDKMAKTETETPAYSPSLGPNREAKEEEIAKNKELNKGVLMAETKDSVTDEERYKQFQDTGINTKPGVSITEDSKRAQEYQQKLQESDGEILATSEGASTESIDDRLNEIYSKLNEIQDQLNQLLEGQELSGLGKGELLEYIRLLSARNGLKMSKIETLLESSKPVLTNEDLGKSSVNPALERQEVEEFMKRDENTWGQRSADYAQQLEEYDEIIKNRPLTNQEKVKYFNILNEKNYIDKNILAPIEQKLKKIERKEKIIKWVAGSAGFGIALATPPAAVAAVVAVTLGGRYIGKSAKKWSEKLRSTSNTMKYEDRRGKTREELDIMDEKQRRKEWWADRLGEASAVLIGGSVGYGIGSAVQNIFGWKGIGGEPGTPGQPSPDNSPPSKPDITTNSGSGTSNIPTPSDVGGSSLGEGVGNTEWFKASDYGWDFQKLGWQGNQVSLDPQGGQYGLLQKNFFGELMKLVPKEGLVGQTNGQIANQFLRQTYNGVNPTQAAQSAAQALGY